MLLYITSATLFIVLLQNDVHCLELHRRVMYSLEEAPVLFDQFIEEHNKKYDEKEKEERFKIFVDNLKKLNSLNERSSNAVYGINKFSDLSAEEFKQLYTGLDPKQRSWNDDYKTTDVALTFNNTAPDEFDWRSKGVVSSVKNQDTCRACWAFSTCGNVESINAIKTGKIIDVSEQQLVDCDKKSSGCKGGWPWFALRYFVENGAMSLSSYPYIMYDRGCQYNSSKVVIKLKNYKHITNLTEDQIKEHLYNIGPLIIDIASAPIQGYAGDIITTTCKDSKDIDHSVLLVGYGEENQVKYWIVKNSWSKTWGENGYFRMQRGVNCLFLSRDGISTAVI